jgi:hypothetical protein
MLEEIERGKGTKKLMLRQKSIFAICEKCTLFFSSKDNIVTK